TVKCGSGATICTIRSIIKTAPGAIRPDRRTPSTISMCSAADAGVRSRPVAAAPIAQATGGRRGSTVSAFAWPSIGRKRWKRRRLLRGGGGERGNEKRACGVNHTAHPSDQRASSARLGFLVLGVLLVGRYEGVIDKADHHFFPCLIAPQHRLF